MDDYLCLASRLRGEPPSAPEERLAVLGVASLAQRRIRALSHEEARTVALVEAVTSQASVILLTGLWRSSILARSVECPRPSRRA